MVDVFVSYSHEDEELRGKLEKHLASLMREERVGVWHDRKIIPGADINDVVETKLDTAQVVLLLVSSDFVASEYCYDIEVKKAVTLHNAGAARVIPVILRACDWRHTPFGHIAATPAGGVPVMSHADLDAALHEVANDIRRAVNELADRDVKRTAGDARDQFGRKRTQRRTPPSEGTAQTQFKRRAETDLAEADRREQEADDGKPTTRPGQQDWETRQGDYLSNASDAESSASHRPQANPPGPSQPMPLRAAAAWTAVTWIASTVLFVLSLSPDWFNYGWPRSDIPVWRTATYALALLACVQTYLAVYRLDRYRRRDAVLQLIASHLSRRADDAVKCSVFMPAGFLRAFKSRVILAMRQRRAIREGTTVWILPNAPKPGSRYLYPFQEHNGQYAHSGIILQYSRLSADAHVEGLAALAARDERSAWVIDVEPPSEEHDLQFIQQSGRVPDDVHNYIAALHLSIDSLQRLSTLPRHAGAMPLHKGSRTGVLLLESSSRTNPFLNSSAYLLSCVAALQELM